MQEMHRAWSLGSGFYCLGFRAMEPVGFCSRYCYCKGDWPEV